MSRIIVETKTAAGVKHHVLDDPPPGKSYIVVPIDTELVEKTGRLQGHFHEELAAALTRTAEQFMRTRPVEILTPRAAPVRSITTYDPRDPTKGRG